MHLLRTLPWKAVKTHALSQDSECPPVYTTIGELKKSYTVARKPPAPKPAAAAPPTAAGQRQIPPLEAHNEPAGKHF